MNARLRSMLLLSALFLSAVLLSACGSEPEVEFDESLNDEPTYAEPEETYDSPEEPSADEIGAAAFVLAVQSESPEYADVDGHKLLGLGHGVCEDLATTDDFYETSFLVSDAWPIAFGEELSPTDAAAVVGSAIGALCPQFASLME